MKCTRKITEIQNELKNILADKFSRVLEIVKAIEKIGGCAYLVGGAVRDLILDIAITDIDIEVHNIESDKLFELLQRFGPVSLVGKSFGVFKSHDNHIDWALPRTDSSGRHPEVKVDPFLSIKDALARRDLTMNAMAINLTTYEFIDPFGGYEDIKNNILRSPDIQFFQQDPLRFYRVMQFISRFEMQPDKVLNQMCATMDISGVSHERIEAEFDKLMLKSCRPSLGIRWLCEIGRLKEILPELAATIETPQDKEWHPEGNVFEHSMQALDASALLDYDDCEEKLIVMYAVLCHDLGKTTTTKVIKGRIRSPMHAIEGVSLAQNLLHRITAKKRLIEAVKLLVKFHMEPGMFVKQNSTFAAYKRLALKLEKYCSIVMLSKVATADWRGRNPECNRPLTDAVEFVHVFLDRARQAGVLCKPEVPILAGKDLLKFIGPGPQMGKLLKQAYEIQLNSGIKDKEELIKRIGLKK